MIISSSLLLGGCIPRQSAPICYDKYLKESTSTPFDSLRYPTKDTIKKTLKRKFVAPKKKESAFDKILRLNKPKKIETEHKVKCNNNQEEFPSNVPSSFLK